MNGGTVLVTGGTGFLGARVVKALAGSFAQVTSAGRELRLDQDISLPAGQFETVFHLGGVAHMTPRTPEDRVRFHRVNAEGTRKLLEALDARGGTTRFVLISTVAVYGMTAGQDLEETVPAAATDPYGMSKTVAEDHVRAWSRRTGHASIVLRLPLVVGRDAPGNFGRMVKALKKRRYLGIGNGAARRSMVLASDVAELCARLRDAEGTFNLSDGRHPSFSELEEAICSGLGRSMPPRLPFFVAALLGRAGDAAGLILRRSAPFNTAVLEKMTSTFTVSDASARARLGWRPRPVLEAIQECL